MTANHKTYGGMNLSFLHQQSIKRKIWDFESKQAGNAREHSSAGRAHDC